MNQENTPKGYDPRQFEAVTAELADLRDGQHELLRMYEELRDRFPKHCLCAAMRERARAELAALDVLAPETNHEDYQPE